MEKYGQYRDKGSGIAPFFPIASPPSNPALTPYHIFLFFFRLPFGIFAWAVWIFLVQWTPAGGALRKANLWCILGLPGVWWIDIRVDGVQRGSLGKAGRLPGPGSIIASSYTSPLDVLYLAAIFDPIFTQSFPGSRNVQVLSLERALAGCFALPPPQPDNTISLAELVAANPRRVIVVFPECTTSNGKGVLRLSPSLLSASKGTNIFPVSLRYSPADVVTPIPGWLESVKFFWTLFSRQTHSIRVRIGFPVKMAQLQQQQSSSNTGTQQSQRPQQRLSQQQPLSSSSDKDSEDDSRPTSGARRGSGYDTNFFDNFPSTSSGINAPSPAQKVGESGIDGLSSDGDDDDVLSISSSSSAATGAGGKRLLARLSSVAERQSLDIVAESLSRLGRVKTLGLGVEEKIGFVEAWQLGGKGSARKAVSKKTR